MHVIWSQSATSCLEIGSSLLADTVNNLGFISHKNPIFRLLEMIHLNTHHPHFHLKYMCLRLYM